MRWFGRSLGGVLGGLEGRRRERKDWMERRMGRRKEGSIWESV